MYVVLPSLCANRSEWKSPRLSWRYTLRSPTKCWHLHGVISPNTAPFSLSSENIINMIINLAKFTGKAGFVFYVRNIACLSFWRFSDAHVGRWLSGLHQYDKRTDRKRQRQHSILTPKTASNSQFIIQPTIDEMPVPAWHKVLKCIDYEESRISELANL